VELTSRGDEGTRKALAESPDVIVLDLLLPEQVGFAGLEQIRGRTSASVIVLTARTELEERAEPGPVGDAVFRVRIPCGCPSTAAVSRFSSAGDRKSSC